MSAAVRRAPARGRLLWAADTVLTLASQLRASRVVGDLDRLREQLQLALREFESRARRDGSAPERVAQAASILAALLDHVVTSMPWGADTGWRPLGAPTKAAARRPAQTLLEVAGVDSADAGIAELIAVVLALGFDGRAGGADTSLLEQVRSQVTRELPNRTTSAAGFAPPWRSAVAAGNALASWLPLWVSGIAAAALLAALFFGLRVSLGAKSDRLYARIAALEVPVSVTPRPRPAATPRLGALLEAQVGSGELTVRDEIDRSVIVIPEAQLFAAGNAALAPSAAAVLRPVAAALQREPGHIEVVGHTDGTLVPSARYPSEWELSIDRAHAVSDALRALGVPASRLAYNGRANIEPASDAGGNGRAEIILLAGR